MLRWPAAAEATSECSRSAAFEVEEPFCSVALKYYSSRQTRRFNDRSTTRSSECFHATHFKAGSAERWLRSCSHQLQTCAVSFPQLAWSRAFLTLSESNTFTQSFVCVFNQDFIQIYSKLFTQGAFLSEKMICRLKNSRSLILLFLNLGFSAHWCIMYSPCVDKAFIMYFHEYSMHSYIYHALKRSLSTNLLFTLESLCCHQAFVMFVSCIY